MSTCTPGENLLARQRALETHMLAEGGRRFRRRLDAAVQAGEASTEGAGIKLLQSAVAPVAVAMQAMIDEKGKRGPKHLAHRWLALIGADTAAFITARTVIDGLSGKVPLAHITNEIAGLLLDELRFRRFEEKRPALFEYKVTRLPGSNYRHNKKVLEQSIRWAVENPRDDDLPLDLNDLQMSDQHRLLVGSKLIDLFIAATGLVEVVSKTVARQGKKGRKLEGRLYLVATEDAKLWLEKRNAVLEFLTPVALPMVVPPLDWSPTQRGGYRYALRNKFPFVRSRTRDALTQDMPVVYEAVNAIQATAWTINPDVLALVEQVAQRGNALAGLPAMDRVPMPTKPRDIAENDDARKMWRKQARLVHEANRAREIRAKELSKTLLAVEQVRNEGAIYFPCSVDFRGRVYPLTTYLNPQGDDLSKALLKFAQPKPLGEDGAYWLAVHGANCLDETPDGKKVKTMTLDERVQWIGANTKRIVQAAEDPFADIWWSEADEPLQFYAFCVEWARIYRTLEAQDEPIEYILCALPVSLDGSCNGLQHFSAMLLDSIGGKATNLIPAERPQDVYQAVADEVLSLVQADADGGDIIAIMWLASGLVKRKVVKRPTMTFGYGSKLFGMRNQTEEFLLGYPEERRAFVLPDGTDKSGEASLYLARHIWSALQHTVIAAAEGMKWMQDCARRTVTETNKPIRWTVPSTGFLVQQDYFVSNRKQIKTVLAGQVIQPSVYEQTRDVLVHRQTNAVAPNFVHSLDAACLMLTVTRALRAGVTSFGMIHDSYATVPADVGQLATATREAFVEFYQHNDVIASLAQAFGSHYCKEPEKPLPAPPVKGTLKIEGVLASTYFFS